MPGPELSILMAWRDRREVRHALDALRCALEGVSAQVIITNCGGSAKALNSLLARVALPVTVCSVRRRFNKALAINLASRLAIGRYFFILDADILLPPMFFAKMLRAIREGEFATVDRVIESRAARTSGTYLIARRFEVHLVLADGRTCTVALNNVRYADGSRRGCGLMLVSAVDFRGIGGMNSALKGWGWEDNDLNARLQIVRGLRNVSFGTCLHMTHSHRKRDLRGLSPIESEEQNFRRCLQRYERGEFGGTLEEDILRLYGSDT